MNKLKLAFLFLLFNVCMLNSEAQIDYRLGYIVKLNGERESGFINFKTNSSNSKYCYFKKDTLSEAFITYSPEDLLAYRFTNSKYYESKKVPLQNEEKNFFLECLISGKVSVYYLEMEGGEVHYFVKKDSSFKEISNNDVPYEDNLGNKGLKKSNQYKGLLKYYFQDCPSVFQKVNNAVLDKKTLIKLSKQYHEYVCKDQQCIVYEKIFPKRTIGFSFDLSYDLSSILLNLKDFTLATQNGNTTTISTVSNSLKAQSAYEYAFNFSAFTNLNENKTVFLQLSIGYSQFHSTRIKKYDLEYLNIIPDNFTYSYSLLRITPAVKYKLKFNNLYPFVALGVPVGNFLYNKGSLLNTKNNQTIAFTSGGIDDQKGDGFILGLSGEVGAEFPIYGSQKRIFFSLFSESLQANQLTSDTYGIKTGICF